MKSRFLALALSSLLALPCTAATVYTLTPGGFNPALSSTYPAAGGTTLASITGNYSSSTLLGTLTSSVISGDASNPYVGGLTFTYRLAVDPSSPQAASRFTVSSFAGFATDVSYNASIAPLLVSLVNPTSFGRSADGQVVRFSFDNPNVADGQDSALIVVQTDATAYGTGVGAVIDGTSANVATLVPVPEPATGTLILLGIAGAALALKRKQ